MQHQGLLVLIALLYRASVPSFLAILLWDSLLLFLVMTFFSTFPVYLAVHAPKSGGTFPAQA